jgi:outer membrane protein TolC
VREYNIPDWALDAAAGAGSGSGSAAQQQQQEAPKEFYPQIQTTARVTLKQPLVRGFGPDVALANEKRADYEYSAETIKAQLAAEDMVRDIIAGYWELAYATYEVDTRAESLALAEQHEKLTREELRAGKQSQNALNAVLYELAVRKEAHLRAQLDAEKKSLDLRRKVGLGLGRREVLMRPGEALEIGDAEWDVDEVLAQSRKANRKLATIALQKKVADVDVNVTRNATLPQVDTYFTGALVGNGETTGDSISALGGIKGWEIMAGLEVSFELSGARKSAHAASLARRKRLEIDRADLERQIDAEVVSAVKAVTASRTRVELSDRAISVAEENVRAERLMFTSANKGTTNFSVMQRQSELIDARLRRGRAVADYHIAVSQLQYLSGTLLAQYRVNARPRGSR